MLEYHDAVVCYHFPCVDGIFSALIARERLKSICKSLRFVPFGTSTPPKIEALSPLRGNETVYILDFVVSLQFVEGLVSKGVRVVIIDHHKTAKSVFAFMPLPKNVMFLFDVNKCASTLALEFFKPDLPSSVLQTIKFVEDSDLWRFKLEDTHAFRAGLSALRVSWNARTNPGVFDTLLSLNLASILRTGRVRHREQSSEVTHAMRFASRLDLTRASSWGECLYVEGTRYQSLRSRIGNELAAQSLSLGTQPLNVVSHLIFVPGLRGIGIVAYGDSLVKDPSKIKLSFRSLPEEDTTKITEKFGGGGHRNASSCVITTRAFNSWKGH